MELPKRKQNRLTEYDYSTPNAYFITVCTNNRKNLFWKDIGAIIDRTDNIPLTDLGMTVKLAIHDIPKHYPAITVDHAVIMPNHIHFIIEIDGSSGTPTPTNARIPSIVSAFKRMTNKKAGFKMWQRDYNDHIVRSDEDYLRIAEYITNNPYGKIW